jgi:hypothetical protein
MCRNHQPRGPQDERMEGLKFYKHFRIYLIVNAILLFSAVKNGGDMSFMYVTFFWGIAVVNHYFKVFGNKAYQEPYDDFMDDLNNSISEPFKEKKKKPRWRDKDLV